MRSYKSSMNPPVVCDLYVCDEYECDESDGEHGEPDVPVELRPDDLVRLPGGENLHVGEGNLRKL